jgi:hypothetical protein
MGQRASLVDMSLGLLVLGLLVTGCASKPETVYVDLNAVYQTEQKSPPIPAIPKPPAPLPEQEYVIPGASEEILENSAEPGIEKTQNDASEAQKEALSVIRHRLVKIYQGQIDLFAEKQRRLLVDPESARVKEIMPELQSAFAGYASARMPYIAELTFLSGLPDSNPSNAPPPASLKPVPKQRWLRANALRERIQVLDRAYAEKATDILAKAGRLAAEDRLGVLKKVDEFRAQMMDRALQEAAAPTLNSSASAFLGLNPQPSIVLPKQPSREIKFPATAALPPAPQVEFERSGESERVAKELLRRQLLIWSSICGFHVVQDRTSTLDHNRHVRDATKDFERWRIQQKVGP